MLSMVNAVTMLFFCLAIAFVMNVGKVIYERIEMQNTADSISYSGGSWMARGMNSITATNHVMGELMSLVIVHEAAGGKLLDENQAAEQASRPLISKYEEFFPGDGYDLRKSSDLRRLNLDLDTVYQIAKALEGVTPLSAYDRVREPGGLHAEATILDSKGRLKKLLCDVYRVKGLARALQKVPFTAKAGVAMEKAIHPVEEWIGVEYLALNAVESIARSLSGVKKLIRDTILPEAQSYTELVVKETPRIAQEAAREVARRNMVKDRRDQVESWLRSVLPESRFELPLEKDPLAEALTLPEPKDQPVSIAGREAGCCGCPTDRTHAGRDQIVKCTQLARATFPWVVYHRQPVIDALEKLVLSKAGELYKDHTDGHSKNLCDEIQRTTTNERPKKIQLFVIKNGSAPDKGFEAWTDDPDRADRQFAIIGCVKWEPPLLLGEGTFFQQQHPDGRLAVAQTLLYNANPQERPEQKIDLTCKRIVPNRQANCGWDTLNWKPGTRPTELVAKWNHGGPPPVLCPEIELNWQAKLVPTSQTFLDEILKRSLAR